jgi:hypothetical protein
VLDSKTSSFKAIEVKSAAKAVQFARVESQLVLDIPVALARWESRVEIEVSGTFGVGVY